MEGEPANEEKPNDEEWPLDRAEVGIRYLHIYFSWIYTEFGMMHDAVTGKIVNNNAGNRLSKKWEITVES